MGGTRETQTLQQMPCRDDVDRAKVAYDRKDTGVSVVNFAGEV